MLFTVAASELKHVLKFFMFSWFPETYNTAMIREFYLHRIHDCD